MVTVYYTFEKVASHDFVKRILREYYNIPNAEICKSNCGKPYVKNGVFFSITHSGSLLAVAVSDNEVGLDCEFLDGKEHVAALSRFTQRERAEILSSLDFYEHWTAKEAFIKYLGSTIAKDLKNVEFFSNKIYFCGAEQNVFVTKLNIENYTFACVAKRCEVVLRKI